MEVRERRTLFFRHIQSDGLSKEPSHCRVSGTEVPAEGKTVERLKQQQPASNVKYRNILLALHGSFRTQQLCSLIDRAAFSGSGIAEGYC